MHSASRRPSLMIIFGNQHPGQTAENSTLNQLISPHENPAEFSSAKIYKTSAGFMNGAYVLTLCSSYIDLQSFCIPY